MKSVISKTPLYDLESISKPSDSKMNPKNHFRTLTLIKSQFSKHFQNGTHRTELVGSILEALSISKSTFGLEILNPKVEFSLEALQNPVEGTKLYDNDSFSNSLDYEQDLIKLNITSHNALFAKN